MNCPWEGGLTMTRMWRLGWQRPRADSLGVPPEQEKLDRLADETAAESPADLRDRLAV
jgi:hypothetical protein